MTVSSATREGIQQAWEARIRAGRPIRLNGPVWDVQAYPLHMAVVLGKPGFVRQAIEEGEDPNASNRGCTPLFLAVYASSLPCVNALLKGGASVQQSDAQAVRTLFSAIGEYARPMSTLVALANRLFEAGARDEPRADFPYGLSEWMASALSEAQLKEAVQGLQMVLDWERLPVGPRGVEDAARQVIIRRHGSDGALAAQDALRAAQSLEHLLATPSAALPRPSRARL